MFHVVMLSGVPGFASSLTALLHLHALNAPTITTSPLLTPTHCPRSSLVLLVCCQVSPEFASSLTARLRHVNALAPIMPTSKAQVPLDDLLGLRGFELEAVEDTVSEKEWDKC